MHADAHNVSGLDTFRLNLLKGFVDKNGIARRTWCGCRKNKQPSGSDDRSTKGVIAGIDQVHPHLNPTFLTRVLLLQRAPSHLLITGQY
jgi:hypothetical protein